MGGMGEEYIPGCTRGGWRIWEGELDKGKKGKELSRDFEVQ